MKAKQGNAAGRAIPSAALLAAILLLCGPGSGAPAEQASQQPRGEAAAPPRPVFRSTTRLVQVTVVARDGHGKAIEDMTRDEFRLYDNGQEQKIDFFSRDSSEVQPGSAPPLPPDTWSNLSSQDGGTPVNLTAILFDQVNTQPLDQTNARNHIVKFLKGMQPQDRIALYALGEKLRVLHDFTSDSQALLAVLSRQSPKVGRDVPGVTPPSTAAALPPGSTDLDAFVRGTDEIFEQFRITERVYRTTDAFEAMASHLSALPGRKNLMWVSAGFPLLIGYDMDPSVLQSLGLDARLFTDELDRVARALNDANVAVYPVDARGLVLNMGLTSRARFQVDTMEDIAARTGGVAYHDNNDVAAALHSAIADGRLVYTLAFAPSQNQWDGKFHKLKVETRRPGAHLRFRAGYFALPDAPLNSYQRHKVLAEAQWSVFDATQIPFSLQAVRLASGEKQWIKFLLVAEQYSLRFADAEGRHATDLILTLGQKGPDGLLVKEETKTLTFRLKEETYQEVMQHGMRMSATWPLEANAVSFRVVLLDAADGHLGSLEIPLANLRTVAQAAGAPGAKAPATPQPPR
jgi:VWFA-related protein